MMAGNGIGDTAGGCPDAQQAQGTVRCCRSGNAAEDVRIGRIWTGEGASDCIDRYGVGESNSNRCPASGAVVIDLSQNAAGWVEGTPIPRVQLY